MNCNDVFNEGHSSAQKTVKSKSNLLSLRSKKQIKIKSNLHYTRRITPKRVTSCGAHLRGLAPRQHSSKETSQRWRVVGDTVKLPILTCLFYLLFNDAETLQTKLFHDLLPLQRRSDTELCLYAVALLLGSVLLQHCSSVIGQFGGVAQGSNWLLFLKRLKSTDLIG